MSSLNSSTFPEEKITVSNEIIKLAISKQKDINNLLESLNLNQEEKKDDVDVKNDNLLSLCHVIGEEGKIRMNNTFNSQFKESKFILIGEGFSESKEWQVKLVFEPKTGKFYFFIISCIPPLIEGSLLYQIISDIIITFENVSEHKIGLELPLNSNILSLEIGSELSETLKKISLDSTSTSTSTIDVELKVSKRLVKESAIHKFPTEIVISLLESMSLGDAKKLIESSPDLYQNYRSILTSIAKSRIKEVLLQYFKNPTSFLKVLIQCEAIIGGSTILYILSGPSSSNEWIPGDLDIIVPIETLPILHYYLDKKGYVVTSENNYDNDYFLNGYNANNSFIYFRWIKPSTGRKIDISAVPFMRPVDHILTYHSTPPMNYYNGKILVCLFPEYTFNSKLLRNKFTIDRSLTSELAILKYIKRGYLEVENVEFESPWVDIDSDFEISDQEGEGQEEGEGEKEAVEIEVVEEEVDSTIRYIQDLPKNKSPEVKLIKKQIEASLGRSMLSVWGVSKKDLIIEEQVVGKWCLEVELKEGEKVKEW